MSSMMQKIKTNSGTTIHVVSATAVDMLGHPRSSKWDGVRLQHLKLFPFCACCGRDNHLNVHHIKPFHLYPDLELVLSNLVTLCECPSLNCHLFMGHLLDWKLSNPRVVADAKRYLAMLKKIRNKS